jgi:putative oxidoreductase
MARSETARRTGIILGILRGVLALVFVAAGLAKIAGVPFMVEVFDHVGLGQWFRYVAGVVEVGGAILLLLRRMVGVGALVLACTMAGAIIAHLTRVPGSPMPAIVLLVVSATLALAYRRRPVGWVTGVPASQVAL